MPEPHVELRNRLPAPGLRHLIDGYLGYRMSGLSPGLHRGLPSRHLTLIVSIGPAIDVVTQTSPGQAPRSYRAVLGGLQASSAVIAYGRQQEGVAIELTPLGSRALLARPASELWDLSVELSDVLGSAGRELWERLQGPASWDERFATCDEVLSRQRVEAVSDRSLDHCWRALVASGGTVTVSALASATGWSRQYLSRRFRQEFGLQPKLAARIIRFERARRLLDSIPRRLTLSQVALDCGYYDQAHLNRDFSRFAGCTPTQLLADEVPFFQDSAPGGA